MTAMGQCPPPGGNRNESTIVHGLTKAVEEMCQMTEIQMECVEKEKPLLNNCRIICLTHLQG